MDIEFDRMREDEYEAAFRLRSRAFAGPVEFDPEFPQISADMVRVARLNGEVVGTAAVADFGQVIAGAVLPMGGVTGVAVAPHATGRGVARRLMQDLFDLMRERGHPISALYPSTATLYRSVGYEVAGLWTKRSFPLTDLAPSASNDITVTQTGPDDYDTVHQLHVDHALRSNGWVVRDDWWWGRLRASAADPKKHLQQFVAQQAGEPIAFASVSHTETSTVRGALYDFELDDAFGDPLGLAAIGRTLAGHATMAGMLRTVLPAGDVSALTDRFEQTHVEHSYPWMERIIDLPAALAGRPCGYFDGVIELKVHDEQIPSNEGEFALEWDDGGVGVTPAGSGVVDVNIADLSSMFTGWASARGLLARGRLGTAATAADADRLDRCFANASPSMIDFF